MTNQSDDQNNINQPAPPKQDDDRGFFKLLAAANSTGAGSAIALLLGLLMGFGWGYYAKYKSYRADGAEIVNQSVNNQRLDNSSTLQMERRNSELIEDLKSIGFTKSEIEFLLKGDISTLDKVKNKVGRFINDDDPYIPREDCNDDYLGREVSEQMNNSIMNRFDKKPDGGNND